MVTIDENKPRGLAPPFFQRVLKMTWFHTLILLLVLANAMTAATIHFDHLYIDPYQKMDHYYYTEVGRRRGNKCSNPHRRSNYTEVGLSKDPCFPAFSKLFVKCSFLSFS